MYKNALYESFFLSQGNWPFCKPSWRGALILDSYDSLHGIIQTRKGGENTWSQLGSTTVPMC